ncbi:DgaE family pyridoxal phosphate-dependent ammonia lyase [Priestia filamentosa]|uniref:L-seryl-tRNA selenium transferase n=1 Tax=Priestia filamentosa TaxID=1402861 RepID=A0A1X7FK85_9BACI|nr:DgaE family pyridoxal phosphate-dependent ammonia lyase [Priestia filamentosa]AKO91352.1 L-seryl-tRNA selenium transferase [Priestia filamentosa]MDT3765473.1 DgaE family pyridoxal phosphate-dependent ammonia lyase [Priestia filamentosa]OXS67249.1 L-seryl-tRNA selenium transferase [Priestia filamentosa]RJS65266.1 SelA-like pyridoxal phosphate-dependent enzyme [Priestia filamentosa]WCM16530.1 DgaE family pyridoxal phosphate-dependent ammonia lyase [Priestia filamentosa]
MVNSLNAKYGLKRVINASGRMSILGVSAPTDTVMDAMKQGGQNYVEIADLVDKAGDHIARILDSEAAVVVNSASSGIALSVAALVTQGNRRKSERLHQEEISKNEIIMLKGHNVQYGAPVETMIYLGGGELIEVGYANEGKAEHIEDAISENTAAILYVKSHHAVQKNMISVEEAWEVAKRNGVPLIVDAAAEEDIQKYVKYSDLAIYSGSKAIEGPTSGIVGGKRKYIEWLKVQLHCIGRSMKVGKETTFGLLQALDEYGVKEDKSEQEKEMLQTLMSLKEIEGVQVTIVQDEAGRAIFRARIQINSEQTNTTAKEVVQGLREGDIAIYTRDYGVRQGYFDIDPRPLQGDDIDVIESQIRKLLGGK